MKATKITYWVSTILIVLFEGLMPALTFASPMAKQGISHLGYPEYFRVTLTLFKVLGALVLILPMMKGRIKEWAYAGFTFDFICAAVSISVVDGFAKGAFLPLIALIILAFSYFSYHKMTAITN